MKYKGILMHLSSPNYFFFGKKLVCCYSLPVSVKRDKNKIYNKKEKKKQICEIWGVHSGESDAQQRAELRGIQNNKITMWKYMCVCNK